MSKKGNDLIEYHDSGNDIDGRSSGTGNHLSLSFLKTL